MPSRQLANFEQALTKLREMLARDASDEAVRDAAIQRFEFTYETCWKALKHHLTAINVVAGSPRDVVLKASREGLVPDLSVWHTIIQDRNLTSHVYNEAVAQAIFGRLASHMAEFERLRAALRQVEGL
ncbi:MAG: HI0074 family nucleotidyltransferase substrate-binding subunit [Candidatus Sericytochromatia bacterium]|nr:HI0074 family nucleotidyltransferase substrate-binding subunit [Candidatus Sericytochromatia bacterium]